MAEPLLEVRKTISDVSPGARRDFQVGAEAQRAREAARPAAVTEQHRKIQERARAATAQDTAAEPTEDAADGAAPREDVESIELEMPNGATILFGPPPGVALQMRVASILGNDLSAYTAQVVRSMLCVRQINGRNAPQISNMVDVQKVMNMIGGEDAVDLTCLALTQYWPPATVKDLRVIKKNLRG